jgi:hypothetical protein
VDFAVRALADFERITLSPGESGLYSCISRRIAAILVECGYGRHVFAGGRKVYVGASSRDLRLELRLPDEGSDSTGR